MKTNSKTISVKRLGVMLLAVLVLMSALCIPVSAETESLSYEIPGTNMTITLPEGALLLAADMPENDPIWLEAGVLDAGQKLTEMRENQLLAEIRAFDGKCVIAVAAKASDYAQAVFNLNNLDEQQKSDFLDRLRPQSADGSTGGSITWVEHAQIPFFCIDINSTAVDDSGEAVYERLYATLYDGKIVSFDLYNGTEEIPEEYDALMRSLVGSAVISEFQEAPEYKVTPQMVGILFVLGALIALIIGFFIYRSCANKREKREKRLMANQLAEYRQTKAGREDEGTGELRFVNETEHSDAAIKTFALFHAYRRNIFIPLFTIVIGLVALYVVWISGGSEDWWLVLLLAACVLFTVYKLATLSTNITKSLMRVYGKLRSRKAAYYFYEGDFRITGLQASNLHPYFQVTNMYETREYFYLYFGTENTYFIKKDGFKEGDVDAFRAFMKEKLGKKFK